MVPMTVTVLYKKSFCLYLISDEVKGGRINRNLEVKLLEWSEARIPEDMLE